MAPFPPDRPGAERKVPFVPKASKPAPAAVVTGGKWVPARPAPARPDGGRAPAAALPKPLVAASSGAGEPPAKPAPAGDKKITIKKTIADRIRELNASGQLQGELKIPPIAKAFAPLDTPSALGVLDSLVDTAPDTKNPTAWVCDVAASVAEEKGLQPAEQPPVEEDEPQPPAKVRRTEAGSSRALPLPPRPQAVSGRPALGRAPARPIYEAPPMERYGYPPPRLPPKPLERRPELLKYKTSLCRHWERNGHCEHGSLCHFAHGPRDLRTQLMNEQEFLRPPPPEPRPQPLPQPRPQPLPPVPMDDAEPKKRDICRDFVRIGRCKWGNECRFSHDVEGYLDEVASAEAALAAGEVPQASDEGGHPKRKTDLCRHFERGFCPRGVNCDFAHGKEELRSVGAPPLMPEQLGPRTGEICRDFERGECKFGSACRFSHDMGPVPQPMVASPRGGGDGPPERREPDDPAKYKTVLCRHFARGVCQMGPDCQFAHGPHELRRQGEPPRISMPAPPGPGMIPGGICRDFVRGRCNFGNDCRFSHVDPGAAGPDDMDRDDPRKELCKYFLRGTCQLGDMCRFPHSLDDEKEEAPTGRDQICRDFLRGRCKFGIECRFSHEMPDGVGDADRGEGEPEQDIGSPRSGPEIPYKSSICQNFERGYCELGVECQFAHGEEELLPPEDARSEAPDDRPEDPIDGEASAGVVLPDKAEICVDFRRGVCKFGSSCRFIHNVEELGMRVTRVPWTSGGSSSGVGPLLVSPMGGEGDGNICRDFARGRCNFGRDCRFSHGEDQGPPRPAPDWGRDGAPPPPPNVIPIKFKMERCRHFDRGHCQLGDLCGYAHGEEEMSLGGCLSYLSG